jgi:hypothetical protein
MPDAAHAHAHRCGALKHSMAWLTHSFAPRSSAHSASNALIRASSSALVLCNAATAAAARVLSAIAALCTRSSSPRSESASLATLSCCRCAACRRSVTFERACSRSCNYHTSVQMMHAAREKTLSQLCMYCMNRWLPQTMWAVLTRSAFDSAWRTCAEQLPMLQPVYPTATVPTPQHAAEMTGLLRSTHHTHFLAAYLTPL